MATDKILVIHDIIEFLESSDNNQASTECINRHFNQLGYTRGQISGVLFRGIVNKELEKPYRAVYKIADINVLDILKDKMQDIEKFIEQISYISYNKLDEEKKQEFNELVSKIKALSH